jgi:hypothetical protein
VKAGDSVVFRADPDLYGVGTIRGVLKNGMLAIDFDGQVDHFKAMELELASVYYERPGQPSATSQLRA